MNYSNVAVQDWTVLRTEGGMHRHCNWDLSSLQGHVSMWFKGNDCSRSRAFCCTTDSTNKIVHEKRLKDFWNCNLALHPQPQAMYSLQFQAMYSLQFYTLNIPPQQLPMHYLPIIKLLLFQKCMETGKHLHRPGEDMLARSYLCICWWHKWYAVYHSAICTDSRV